MRGYIKLWKTPLIFSIVLAVITTTVSIWVSIKSMEKDMAMQVSAFNTLNETIHITYQEIATVVKKDRIEESKKVSILIEKSLDYIDMIINDQEKVE
ncbi:MAG: hypothetical protein J7L34_02305, partial [Thermotogaceae bacterium]|nr:hypothetical protein [Thermotogaceae bacterium]